MSSAVPRSNELAEEQRAAAEMRSAGLSALEVIGSGFLQASPALRGPVRQGERGLQQQLLRFLYRVIFVLVIEEDDLLLHPSLEARARACYARDYSLHELVDRPRPHAYSKFCELVQALGGSGDSRAGIPALGSTFWSTGRVPDLARISLPDETLVRGVELLLPSIRRVAGNVRLLGSAYEGLLDLRPAVSRDGHFELQLCGSERKETGSFYTPQALVDEVLARALDPLLERVQACDDREAALLGLRILDPACGSGHFLGAACTRLAAELALIRQVADEDSCALRAARQDVVRSCLYGVDISETAVDLCKLSLWLLSVRPGMPLTFLDHHIVVGNSLLGTMRQTLGEPLPADAFEPTDDDDRKVAGELKKRNAIESSGQRVLASMGSEDAASKHAIARLSQLPESSIESVRKKEKLYRELTASPDFRRAKRVADAWCAAFLLPKQEGRPHVTQATLVDLRTDAAAWPTALAQAVEALARKHGFIHWHVFFPEVFDRSPPGFDAVVGNPPFLNQLESSTSTAARVARLMKFLYSGGAYADAASLFLLASTRLCRHDGWVALIQPQSLLVTRDSHPIREQVLQGCSLRWMWIAGERAFEAQVMVAGIGLQRRVVERVVIERSFGRSFEPLDPLELDRAEFRRLPSWAPIMSEDFSIPSITISSGRTVGDVGRATADFRDQFYGLIPYVYDDCGADNGAPADPALITTGLIDPARVLWSVRSARFARVTYERPRARVEELLSDPRLGKWAAARLVPKVLVATQTKVLEAVVDEDGVLLPSIPIISVTSESQDLWKIAAALMSPPITAWALARFVGAGLSAEALKLSAAQVMQLPLPQHEVPWEGGAAALRRAARAKSEAEWRDTLTEMGTAMCAAYGIGERMVLEWWRNRLPKWVRSRS